MDDYVSVDGLAAELAADRPPLVVDVRSAAEHAAGHLPGARHLPGDQLARHLGELPRGKPVVTY